MALHMFVFLLVDCLLLSASAALASGLVASSVFLLTRRGQGQHAPPSAEALYPRRLPCLSSRLDSLVGWKASACSCTPLARGQKPTRSTQAREDRGLCLPQSAVLILRHHRHFHPCSGGRWHAWTCRTHPDLSLPGLSHHVHGPATHPTVPAENPFPPDRPGALCSSLRAGCFGSRTGLRVPAGDHITT